MSWTAIVPLKSVARKSRLAGRLSIDEREALSERLFEQVVRALGGARAILRILPLAETTPFGWAGSFLLDGGSGLNAELDRAVRRLERPPIVVIHADLPLVAAADIDVLLSRPRSVAIAPDRHSTGTNAIALPAGREFRFAFGPGSFTRHCEAAGHDRVVVERPGLALDCDTPDDLDLAIAGGFAV